MSDRQKEEKETSSNPKSNNAGGKKPERKIFRSRDFDARRSNSKTKSKKDSESDYEPSNTVDENSTDESEENATSNKRKDSEKKEETRKSARKVTPSKKTIEKDEDEEDPDQEHEMEDEENPDQEHEMEDDSAPEGFERQYRGVPCFAAVIRHGDTQARDLFLAHLTSAHREELRKSLECETHVRYCGKEAEAIPTASSSSSSSSAPPDSKRKNSKRKKGDVVYGSGMHQKVMAKDRRLSIKELEKAILARLAKREKKREKMQDDDNLPTKIGRARAEEIDLRHAIEIDGWKKKQSKEKNSQQSSSKGSPKSNVVKLLDEILLLMTKCSAEEKSEFLLKLAKSKIQLRPLSLGGIKKTESSRRKPVADAASVETGANKRKRSEKKEAKHKPEKKAKSNQKAVSRDGGDDEAEQEVAHFAVPNVPFVSLLAGPISPDYSDALLSLPALSLSGVLGMPIPTFTEQDYRNIGEYVVGHMTDVGQREKLAGLMLAANIYAMGKRQGAPQHAFQPVVSHSSSSSQSNSGAGSASQTRGIGLFDVGGQSNRRFDNSSIAVTEEEEPEEKEVDQRGNPFAALLRAAGTFNRLPEPPASLPPRPTVERPISPLSSLSSSSLFVRNSQSTASSASKEKRPDAIDLASDPGSTGSSGNSVGSVTTSSSSTKSNG